MINFVLKNPIFYRLYQKTVRRKKHEYDFFKFIFKKIDLTEIRLLDLCCGDSYVLEYVNNYVDDYMGIDNHEQYLSQCKKRWKKYNFLNLDITNKNNIKYLIDFNPNFIFMNGAIHHLNDETVKIVNSFILNELKNCYFMSVDPIIHNNNLINNLMIKLDRGKFIRNEEEYKKLMNSFNSFIIDDFYKMNFENIFHFRNFELVDLYNKWKNEN